MRPTYSYQEFGDEAWFEDKRQFVNPYVEDTLAWTEWQIGNLKADIMAGGSDEDDDGNNRLILMDTEAYRNQLLSKMYYDLPTADEVAEAIGTPLTQWPGNCYGIAQALLKSGLLDDFQSNYGRLHLTYGSYTGYIDPKSPFGGRPFTHHAWLESFNGHVVDPTRFVFLDSYPDIFVGIIDDYDLGGARLRARLNPTPPQFEASEARKLPLNDPSSLAVFDKLLGNRDGEIGRSGVIGYRQLGWIGNLSLHKLGENAPMIYRTLAMMGEGGIIPQDNRNYIEALTESLDASHQLTL